LPSSYFAAFKLEGINMRIATKKQLKLSKSTIRELNGDEGDLVGGGAVGTVRTTIVVPPVIQTKSCNSAIDRCPSVATCVPSRQVLCQTTTAITTTRPTR
jgi:hypothetical protein